MKKLTSVLLALLLAATLCVVALAEEAFTYVGTWTVTTLEMNGAAMDPTVLGMSISMTLNEDGTCVLNAMGMEQAGTWATTETGITTTDADGVVDAYTLTDGQLVAEQQGMKLVFTYGDAAAPAEDAEMVNICANLTLEGFNGTWEFTGAETMGMFLPPEMLGMTITLELANGTGVFTVVQAGNESQSLLACEIEEIAEFGTVMWTYVLDNTGAAVGYGPSLVLYEDGVMVWDASTEEQELCYYFEQPLVEATAE